MATLQTKPKIEKIKLMSKVFIVCHQLKYTVIHNEDSTQRNQSNDLHFNQKKLYLLSPPLQALKRNINQMELTLLFMVLLWLILLRKNC